MFNAQCSFNFQWPVNLACFNNGFPFTQKGAVVEVILFSTVKTGRR